MKKKVTKSTPQKKYDLVAPPPYTEGHWEDEFEYWTNYQPSSNNGKWWITIQLEKLKKKLNRYK
jgi:hypothetical protein